MTQSITPPRLDALVSAARVNLPSVPEWVIRRPRIEDRLDVGVSGLVTAVTAPTGSGKTTAVASWAANAHLSGGVVWLNVASIGADPDLFWQSLRSALTEAGMPHPVPVPAADSSGPARFRLLAALGAALRVTGPWVVVLDDYPTGARGRLERDLGVLQHHARRAVRLVVLSRGDPALPLHRHAADGELTRIVAADLAMDTREVSRVLRRQGLDATTSTISAVEAHTAGWACGVHLAAAAIRSAPTLTEALADADAASVDFLSREFLADVAPPTRDLLVLTSVAEVVTPALARCILGPQADALGRSLAGSQFVDVRRDGSFRCHPVLRAAALAQLSQEGPGRAAESRRRAARWYAAHGDTDAGIRLGMAAGDWRWVAEAMVESFAVPRLLTGTAGDRLVHATEVAAVGKARPVLLAAKAFADGNVEAAAAALRRAAELERDEPRASVAHRLSVLLTRLVIARFLADPRAGRALARDARNLLAEIPADEHWAELSTMLDAQLGALLVCAGDLQAAAIVLGRGATATVESRLGLAVRADCAGQLALVEALRGNLRRATQHADLVLSGTTAPGPIGLVHAHLAMASVHLERLELVPARERLDAATELGGRSLEPWLGCVRRLLEGRCLTADGQPDAALRSLTLATAEAPGAEHSWVGDLLAVASAEALVRAGESRRALARVSSHPTHTPVEAAVVAVSALSDLGDHVGARSALDSVVTDLAAAPLGQQIECWLLEARFADEDGRVDRARSLVERAFRLATGEMLRRPFAERSAWLPAFVARDVTLRRAGSSLLEGLAPGSLHAGSRARAEWSHDILVETLTARETEVLALLAEMCSTEEIAGELFLSVNTIKTYVRGILRKLCVNRRVDAVRRGRELGLC